MAENIIEAFAPISDVRHNSRQRPDTASHVAATPFEWVDPTGINPREWIYGSHHIRRFVSATVAFGGIGKTALGVVEALSICTGQALLGKTPNERVNIWFWNGEDPLEEMQRRFMAAVLHHRIRRDELGRVLI